MEDVSYNEVIEEELILRDVLAADRTILANERTLLAYIRTCFAVAAGGISLIKLFRNPIVHFIGYFLIGFAAIVLMLGFKRYRKVTQDINGIPKEPETLSEELDDIKDDFDDVD